jgi:hypothetical protein
MEKETRMRRATIDTTEAQSFEAVEPGPYLMKVDEIKDPAPSEEKGTMGTWVYFAFQDPGVAKKAGRVRRFYPLVGKGAGFFREFWKAAAGEDIPVGQTIDVDLDDGVGRSVLVNIGNEEYQGRTQNTAEKVVAA